MTRTFAPSPDLPPDVRAGDRCERRDSNPHALRHRNLNPACLPVPPLSRTYGRTGLRRFFDATPSSSPHFLPTFASRSPWRASAILLPLLHAVHHGVADRRLVQL